jgi:hypothetical protein
MPEAQTYFGQDNVPKSIITARRKRIPAVSGGLLACPRFGWIVILSNKSFPNK